MDFHSEVEKDITALEANILSLKAGLKREREDFAERKIGEGWVRFLFISCYYGSHEEYGEGDFGVEYLFRPSVDFAKWQGVGFSHGHHSNSKSNEDFEIWLRSLEDDEYIVLGDIDPEVVQGG